MAGIKDKVAVIGMGCTKFGERWDCGLEDLLTEAITECCQDAAIDFQDIDAFWFGTFTNSTFGGLPFSQIMKPHYKPVTRIENLCATGSDTFRNACYAVASGAYDVVMAVGAEKLKDSGSSGLELLQPHSDRTTPEPTAPARFALLAPAYAEKISGGDGLSEKNHGQNSLEKLQKWFLKSQSPIPFPGAHRCYSTVSHGGLAFRNS